jgi:hypothetical protein
MSSRLQIGTGKTSSRAAAVIEDSDLSLRARDLEAQKARALPPQPQLLGVGGRQGGGRRLEGFIFSKQCGINQKATKLFHFDEKKLLKGTSTVHRKLTGVVSYINREVFHSH